MKEVMMAKILEETHRDLMLLGMLLSATMTVAMLTHKQKALLQTITQTMSKILARLLLNNKM